MKNTPEIWDYVDEKKDELIELSDRIWGMPETCYMEQRSSKEHLAELERQGFAVKSNLADIPTAIMGEAGNGGPVIAFLGEYDALPGLSQQAGIAQHQPVTSGGNGHGCGHNLLGAGALLAATAVKNWLVENKLPGTVRYYGCPAEEGGAAKAFMVKAGLFDDVDFAITWHPAAAVELWSSETLANTRVDFSFLGRSSHASEAPHLGRSALDAVELMNVGVNYMREHMPSDARVHYAMLDGGGIAPNVVQGYAKVRYAVRARNLDEMFGLLERVKNIARGAALMTETKVTIEVISAVANYIPCGPLQEIMARNIVKLGAPEFDEADANFAREIQRTLSPEEISHAFVSFGREVDPDKALADFIVASDPSMLKAISMGSTDVADVSWVVPTVQLNGANFAIGTPFHSWQLVAQGKSPAALKGMVHAAKAMAATAVDAIHDKDLIAKAKAAHEKRAGKANYKSPIPDGTKPPIAAMTW